MRTINNIFVHCTATQPSATIEALRNGFRARGWHAPGYHYVIEADGTLRRLWAEEHVANGVRGYNQHAIHVAYIGGIDPEGRPKDTRTCAQRTTLEALLRLLHWHYPTARIRGHREVNPNKACPSYDIQSERQRLEED